MLIGECSWCNRCRTPCLVVVDITAIQGLTLEISGNLYFLLRSWDRSNPFSVDIPKSIQILCPRKIAVRCRFGGYIAAAHDHPHRFVHSCTMTPIVLDQSFPKLEKVNESAIPALPEINANENIPDTVVLKTVVKRPPKARGPTAYKLGCRPPSLWAVGAQLSISVLFPKTP